MNCGPDKLSNLKEENWKMSETTIPMILLIIMITMLAPCIGYLFFLIIRSLWEMIIDKMEEL